MAALRIAVYEGWAEIEGKSQTEAIGSAPALRLMVRFPRIVMAVGQLTFLEQVRRCNGDDMKMTSSSRAMLLITGSIRAR